MKDLKHPAKPLFQNVSDVDVTILSNEESAVEDYHIMHLFELFQPSPCALNFKIKHSDLGVWF